MKNIILASIAAGGLAVLLAGPAAAQNANGNANTGANAASGFTVKNVNPIRPFGSINTYNVGVDPARISAWAKSTERRPEAGDGGPLLGDHPEPTELLFGNDQFLPELRHRDSGKYRRERQRRSVNESAEGIAGLAAGLPPPRSPNGMATTAFCRASAFG